MPKERFGPKGMYYEDNYRIVHMSADGGGDISLKAQPHN